MMNKNDAKRLPILGSCESVRLYAAIVYTHHSGVTRVGVARCGSRWYQPILFPLEKKLTNFFSHRPLETGKVMTFLAVVFSPLPSSHVVYPVFFLNSATEM